MDRHALWLSLELASLTTLGLLVLGLPLAQWLATTRWRWKIVAEAVISLPLVLPPTVIGYYLLVSFGPRSPMGRAWIELTGRPLAFTFEGLVVASLLYGLPFAIQPFVASLSAVDRRLVEASWSLGRSRLATFFKVTLPLAAPGVIAGAVLVFAHTLGEFGVVLMVGGNLPGLTRTVSISMYDDVQSLNFVSAHQTALALLVFSFAALSTVYALLRKPWAAAPWR